MIFLALGYYRAPAESYGLTTEMAALLTFWLGYLMRSHEVLAISTGIVVVILLAAKETLHDFVRKQVSEEEFFDTLKFLAVVFVVFPLLPNRYIGPFEFFNPTQVWGLIVVVSAISYVGYVLMRVFGSRRGLVISSLLGGIVSTLAVTLSLAERAKNMASLSRICGVTGVMANAIQFPRLLFLVWLVDRSLAIYLTVPLFGMALVGIVGSFAFSRSKLNVEESTPVSPVMQNPFSLKPVLKFGIFFVGVVFITKVSRVWFGTEGIYVASVLSGIGSVSAIALSLADMVSNDDLSHKIATYAIFLALISNACTKWLLSYINGNREIALWLGGGFLTMLAVGALIIFGFPG